ncbi:helix-turn-helix transcriptional regulator, partial [uncultured Dubosiella sp.]
MKVINYFYGPYIRVLREKYHVPQHKLAKKLFLSNGTLSKFEQGKQDMDFDTFSSAISFFEKQESDFIFSTNPEDLENPKIEIQKFIHLFIQLDYWKELPRLEERVPHFDSYGFFYEVLLEAFRLYLKKKPYTKEID